jgi:hypothetical protein
MVNTTITLLEHLGVESFKISKRKKNMILELLGIRNYSQKKRMHHFIITG